MLFYNIQQMAMKYKNVQMAVKYFLFNGNIEQ